MVASLKITTKFEKRALKKAKDRSTFTSLFRAGGFIRTTMRRSIRRRKKTGKPSEPGNAPKSTGPLRDSILFEVSPQKDDVIIGASFKEVGLVGSVQEFGKTVSARQKIRDRDGESNGSVLVKRKYPKRSFAGPALEQARPRLASFWKNSIRS